MRLIQVVTALYCLIVCDVVLSNPIEGEDNVELDKVDITCSGNVTDKIIYKYDHDKPDGGVSRLQPLEYSEQESIYGNLSHNIRITGNGDCYDLVIRLRYDISCQSFLVKTTTQHQLTLT